MERSKSSIWKLLIVALMSCGVGYFCGGMRGEIRTGHKFADEQVHEIAPILAADPGFANVRVERWDDGWVLFTGHVSSEKELERLRLVLVQLIGKKRAELGMQPVKVIK